MEVSSRKRWNEGLWPSVGVPAVQCCRSAAARKPRCFSARAHFCVCLVGWPPAGSGSGEERKRERFRSRLLFVSRALRMYVCFTCPLSHRPSHISARGGETAHQAAVMAAASLEASRAGIAYAVSSPRITPLSCMNVTCSAEVCIVGCRLLRRRPLKSRPRDRRCPSLRRRRPWSASTKPERSFRSLF